MLKREYKKIGTHKECLICKKSFYVCGGQIDKKIFCSNMCKYKGRKRLPEILLECRFCGKSILKRPWQRKTFCNHLCSTNFKKGLVRTETEKIKISQGHKKRGLKYYEIKQEIKRKLISLNLPKRGMGLEGRLKLSKRFKGEGSVTWRGGISKKNHIARHCFEYREWRIAVFKRDKFICQFCNKKGGILHADHLKGFADYPELRFDVNNGRTLCEKCHKATDNYGGKYWKVNKRIINNNQYTKGRQPLFMT